MASVAPSSLTLSHPSALASASFHHQQDVTCFRSFKTQRSIFSNLFLCPVALKRRGRNLIRWVDATSRQQSNFSSFHLAVAVVASEAEIAEDEGQSAGVATAIQPKPEKGIPVMLLRWHFGNVGSHLWHFIFSGCTSSRNLAIMQVPEHEHETLLTSCISMVKHGLKNALAAAIVIVQILSPLPYFSWESYSVFPAKAVLYSPDTRVPRTGELALRRAIPANSNMKEIQDSLEDISYLLRIPQRKPYGTMEANVKKALKIAVDEKEAILASIPSDLRERGSLLYTSLIDGKGGLQALLESIKEKDPDKVYVGLASSLDCVAELELLQAPGLSFLLPAQYLKYPRLTGRGTVEFTIEKRDGSIFSPQAGGEAKNTAIIEVILDGYSSPLTAGNFAKLVIPGLGIKDLIIFNEALLVKWLRRIMNEKDRLWRKVVGVKYGVEGLNWRPSSRNGPFGMSMWKYITKKWDQFYSFIRFEVTDRAYDGTILSCTSQAVLSDSTLDRSVGYSAPLEIMPSGQFEPLYKTTLSIQDGELPVLPLSVFGAVAMAHSEVSEEYSSPNQFFFYLYDKRNAGLGGLSFDEGQFSVFGYTTAGREILSQIKTGDIIRSAKLVEGRDHLILPDKS